MVENEIFSRYYRRIGNDEILKIWNFVDVSQFYRILKNKKKKILKNVPLKQIGRLNHLK